MADCDELEALRKVKMYIKNLESKVRELELMATIREQTVERHGQTIKTLEQTVENLRGYNKIWRETWHKRDMRVEVPLLNDLYFKKMTVSDFQKKRSRVYGFTLEFDK
jgi:hypothetical protein